MSRNLYRRGTSDSLDCSQALKCLLQMMEAEDVGLRRSRSAAKGLEQALRKVEDALNEEPS